PPRSPCRTRWAWRSTASCSDRPAGGHPPGARGRTRHATRRVMRWIAPERPSRIRRRFMPTLKYFVGKGTPKLYSIHKPVTTIGRAPGNDVVIAGAEVLPSHLQIAFDGRDFVVEELEKAGQLRINNKKKRRARLVHGDRLFVGEVEIAFSMFAEGLKKARVEGDVPTETQATALGSHEIAGVRKLFSFSEKLSNS